VTWTAWNNGRHHESGAGYGFKVDIVDRDREFLTAWVQVEIVLPSASGPVRAEARIDKASFWSENCRELISRTIGEWLIREGHAPWHSGSPPQFLVRSAGEARFEVIDALKRHAGSDVVPVFHDGGQVE
jgi:hypothetical protein